MTFKQLSINTKTGTTRKWVPRPSGNAVWPHMDYAKLCDILTRDSDTFSEYAERVELEPHKDGTPRFYYYKDNGADVLAVAHLDSVCQTVSASIADTADGPIVHSGQLDDRLGAYVILELLPSMGITCDWLLTTDEEMGASTAEEFTTLKNYKWAFQFDRGGTDVVMYEYETPELVDLVEATGVHVGSGSFSDICMLDFLGCAGINWGVGYQDYHGPRGHAWLNDTCSMVEAFAEFYRLHSATHFEYTPVEPAHIWEGDDASYLSFAAEYDIQTAERVARGQCPDCYEHLIGGAWCADCGVDWKVEETAL